MNLSSPFIRRPVMTTLLTLLLLLLGVTGYLGLPVSDLPNVDFAQFAIPTLTALTPAVRAAHPPRILLLYGSLRTRSFSRMLTLEAERLLRAMGAETRVFDPAGLPLPDGAPESHPKVEELRGLAGWCEGMVWTSPERHGAMTGLMKAQIDWIPLALGAVRPPRARRSL